MWEIEFESSGIDHGAGAGWISNTIQLDDN